MKEWLKRVFHVHQWVDDEKWSIGYFGKPTGFRYYQHCTVCQKRRKYDI